MPQMSLRYRGTWVDRRSWCSDRAATSRFVDNRARTRLDAPMRRAGLLAFFLVVTACGGQGGPPEAPAPSAKASASTPRRAALAGGPYPAILVAQAQFTEGTGPDGKQAAIPGAAKLVIVRRTESGWKPVVLEDPDSNVFHKALPWDGGILTIGGNQALLRPVRFADGRRMRDARWNPKFR